MNSEMYEEFKVRYDLLQDLSNRYWSDACMRCAASSELNHG